MATEICMPDPVCLIENVKGRLKTNEKALEILSSIKQPVVVVAIVGLYRTGKSYLMNKLAGKKTGFSLGSTVQSHTKGIWIWCVPHPQKPDHSLVLLDTEGLGDVEKGDNQNDCWIFALAVLLSSTLVNNSLGAINQQAMDNLHYVTELTQRIRARSSPDADGVEDSADFVSFFPDFVWTLRDMTLKLEVDGQCLTADEYLENSLKLKQGTSEEDKKYNLPRLCIQKFFPKKKCFIFNPPTEWKKLPQLETLQDTELDSEFLQQVAGFCSYIFNYSKAKTLPGGIKVHGQQLKNLVQTYVNAISSGDLVCMESTVLTLVKIENLEAVKKAMAHYDQQMAEKVQLPTETLLELLELHRSCEREAMEIFFDASFKDEGHVFQKDLLIQLESRWDGFCKQNLKASSDRCTELLQNIFCTLEESVKQGVYSQPGGYLLFIQKREELRKKYLQEAGKGTQAEEILQTYLQSKETVTEAILQADQALTKKNKEIEEERARAESAQATAKMLEEVQKNFEQMMEEKDRHHQEHVRQLTVKMERDRAQIMEEQEITLAFKLQEQEQLQEENRRLQNEIQNMKMRNREKEAESAQAGAHMLSDVQKMTQFILAEEEGDRLGHMKQFPERVKKETFKYQVTMASEPMRAPVCLVDNKNSQLSVNPQAVQILKTISQPVVVVAIAGMYRTGKSYLLNCLSGQNHGFSLGSTVQSETKGIWMWCVPHPTRPNHTLVLLDTEGLGDVEKGDPKNDSWIFTLAVLLSSAFVYNSMNTINHQALEQLHYVSELTNLIRARSSPRTDGIEDASDFVGFFPDFIWTVRDFTLELKLDGDCITEDEYLENALKLIPGNNPQIQMHNKPRECICNFFPKRKCFVFDRPVSDPRLLAQIEDIPESQLNPQFQEQSKAFCSYIFTHASTKMLQEGILVTGDRLGSLVETYVGAINSGTVPCLENAVTTLAQRENSVAVQKAAEHYNEQMAQSLRLPTDTLQELLEVHTACEKEAIAVFMDHSFKDENWEFQKNLMTIIEERKEDFLLQNEEASVTHCEKELKQLSEPLLESISRGDFYVPGGHSLYLEAKKKVEQEYERAPRKGVKANEVLQSFLKSQATIEDSILKSDKVLTETEKTEAAKQAKKQVAEKEAELQAQKRKEQEQMRQAQQRSYSENMAQLQQKIEKEIEDLMREQERILDHKTKDLEQLSKPGFEEKYEQLIEEMRLREEEIERQKKNEDKILKILEIAGPYLISALPVLCKAGKKLLHMYF